MRPLSTASIGLLFLCIPAQAAVVLLNVDTFAGPAGGQSIVKLNDNTPGSAPVATGLPTSQTIGGARKLNLLGVSGTTVATQASATANAANSGLLSVWNDPGVYSAVELIWDGGGGPANVVQTLGLGGVDLTVGSSASDFIVTLVGPASPGVTWDWDIHDMSGNLATYVYAKPQIPGTYLVPFTNWSGVNFANVGAMRLVIAGPTGYFDPVDSIATGSAPTPATLVLLAPALLGLAAACRRRSGKGGRCQIAAPGGDGVSEHA